MIITKEQLAELIEAAKPLNAFLEKNCHPHCKVIIEYGHVELLEGVAGYPLEVEP